MPCWTKLLIGERSFRVSECASHSGRELGLALIAGFLCRRCCDFGNYQISRIGIIEAFDANE